MANLKHRAILAVFIPVVLFSSMSLAEAGRSVVAPPYMRRIIFEFTGPPTPPDGSKIGSLMSVVIVLSNLSSVSQSGTLSLSGSAGAAEVARPDPISTQIVLCADSSSGATGTNPTPATFTLGPKQTKSFTATVYFTSQYQAAGPGGHTVFDAVFTPTIEIGVDQDRGAITGVITPTWDGPAGGSLCDGTSLNGAVGPAQVSEGRTGVPLLVNGGRPF